MITLRPFRLADAVGLLELFRVTIQRVNAVDYSPDQIRAWASDQISLADWTHRFAGRFTIVAELDGVVVGFTDMETDGHIDRFFVSSSHQRCGIGRSLLSALVDEAHRIGLVKLFTEASITALPFFEAHGFRVLVEQLVLCRGVEFMNYCMERSSGETTGFVHSSQQQHLERP